MFKEEMSDHFIKYFENISIKTDKVKENVKSTK